MKRNGIWVFGLAGWILAIPVAAKASSADVQKKLDTPISITVQNKPIEEVFRQLAGASGVKCVIGDDALRFLPYGKQTRMNVVLKDVALRQALPRMLNPQALTWEMTDDGVRIVPSEPLYRMCRRPSYDELALLGKIITTNMETSPAATQETILKTLQDATWEKTLKMILPKNFSEIDLSKSTRQAKAALPGTVADWLDMFCRSCDLTWYLDKNSIILLSQKDQIKRQLEQVVSLRYQNAQLVQVLLDLARQGRVKLTLDPGVLNPLPAETRNNFSLIMADATIDQALQVISGATGLDFVFDDDGVRAKMSLYMEAVGSLPTSNRKSLGFFVQMDLPVTGDESLKVFLVPDQLPAPLRDAIQAERKRMIGKLEKHFGVGKYQVRIPAPAQQTPGEEKASSELKP